MLTPWGLKDNGKGKQSLSPKSIENKVIAGSRTQNKTNCTSGRVWETEKLKSIYNQPLH